MQIDRLFGREGECFFKEYSVISNGMRNLVSAMQRFLFAALIGMTVLRLTVH